MNRRAILAPLSVAAITLLAAACTEAPTEPHSASNGVASSVSETGNGAPSGKRFTLNLIGVDKDKTADMDATSENGIGHRIFVRLNFDDGSQHGKKFADISKINKIFLAPGDDFAVLDANATDRDGALFQLPADVSNEYDVYVRPRGKPGGRATLTTCATVLVDDDGLDTTPLVEEVVCNQGDDVVVTERTRGKQKFENVTSELLFLHVLVDPEDDAELAACLDITDTPDVDDAPVPVTQPLFDPCFEQFFWDYDNNGLKLLQVWFFPKS